MPEQMLFTDGSVNPQSKIGYGACLFITDKNITADELNKQIVVRRFENTSSTKLELQTLLWALYDIQSAAGKLTVYSDCQNIIGLPARRERFESNDYYSKNHKRLNNYQLYQQFYTLIDQLDIELIKVCGHKITSQKNDIDRIFSLVDRASRNALRENN